MHKASKMQSAAIHHGKGPAIVIAGPGSGKTFTIIQRILYLIQNLKVNPEKILTITFTKAAATEMQQRYLKELSDNLCPWHINQPVRFGTFHSICYFIIKETGLMNNYSLIKESEKRKIIEMLLQNQNIEDAHDYDAVTKVLEAISRKKNLLKTSLPLNLTEVQFRKIEDDYEDMLKQQRLLDFDDMILKCLSFLKTNHEFCGKWQKMFEYILVDEFQDINEPQYQVIKLLSASSRNLFAVGDDDQAIYGFRGAAPEIMLRFQRDFPDAVQYLLTENYRSGNCIVDFADKVIKRSNHRFSKTVYPVKRGGRIFICFKESRREEELQLLSDINRISKENQKLSAVIVRTNLEVFQYTALLKQHDISVKEAKTKENDIFHHYIMEDISAFLRFCKEGCHRSDFIKIMNKPNMYLSRMALTGEIITVEKLTGYYKYNTEMTDKINRFFAHCQAASGLSPSLAVRYFRKIIGYDNYLRDRTDNENEQYHLLKIADNIQEHFKKMKPCEKTDEFLKRIRDMDNSGCKNKPQTELPGISVITMHAAKGLEFHSVFLPDLNEGIIPGKNVKTPEETEEERRLLYVAITRAEDSLYLYYTRERNRKLTRFLEGIIPQHQ